LIVGLTAEEINQTAAHIFSHMRDKDGWSIEDKHLYNLETIRIRQEGGDTSKRLLLMSYLGTTYREKEEVNSWRSPTLVWMLSTRVRACN